MRWLGQLKVGSRVLKYLVTHPAGRGRPWLPLLRFGGWQVVKRLGIRSVTLGVFGGGVLRCYPDNAVTNGVLYLGWPDWSEMRFLHRLLRPGDGFLDVGANVGVYSVLACTRIGKEGVVFAIEAEPTLAERLRENLTLNGVDTSCVVQVAVGEREGVCRFEVGRDATGSVLAGASEGGAEVVMRRLDDLVTRPERFTVGKIDVEGFELSVFRGALELFRTGYPKLWLVETNWAAEKYGETRADLQAFLDGQGYKMFRVENGGERLRRIRPGGPFPENSIALADVPWLKRRLPQLVVIE